jgi:hypothetical protein
LFVNPTVAKLTKEFSAFQRTKACIIILTDSTSDLFSILHPHIALLWDKGKGKVKIKEPHYRPGQALRVPGGLSVKVVSPKHRPSLPQEIFLVLISVRG